MQSISKYSRFELTLSVKVSGNPFADIMFEANFSNGDVSYVVPGFYDGEDLFRVRYMPLKEGIWTYETRSNIAELNGKIGEFECTAALQGKHGPVRVSNTFHFAYDDGTAFRTRN